MISIHNGALDRRDAHVSYLYQNTGDRDREIEMSIWFERNGITGTTETAPAGHPVYVVTAANGASMRTDVASLARRVAIEWNDEMPAAPQIVSLPAAERRASGLATGATLTMPSKSVRDMLALAAGRATGLIARGRLEDGCFPLPMLRSAVRRGWLDAADKVRMSQCWITDAGHEALARYDAKHGTSVGAR